MVLLIMILGLLTRVHSIDKFTYNKIKVSFPEDPCDNDVEMPDFSAPGRRISEVKCFEYTWTLRYHQAIPNRNMLCEMVRNNNRVPLIGGFDARPGEYPHMGALGWKATNGTWIFKCGGSLISERFVVTAAHCSQIPKTDTTVTDPKPKVVRFGSTSLLDDVRVSNLYNRKAFDARIRKFIPHNRYKAPRQYYDIALVELENEVTFQWEVHPACLWTYFTSPEKGILTGWGVVDLRTRANSPVLQKAEVPILDYDECEDMLKMKHNRKWEGFLRHQLCAGEKAGGIDTCQGDSGGPLQISIPLGRKPVVDYWYIYHIVGVTSFGFGCAKPNTPSVYTRVASFLGWIEETVWPNSTVQNDNRFYFPT